jgi:hypothetical protein
MPAGYAPLAVSEFLADRQTEEDAARNLQESGLIWPYAQHYENRHKSPENGRFFA